MLVCVNSCVARVYYNAGVLLKSEVYSPTKFAPTGQSLPPWVEHLLYVISEIVGLGPEWLGLSVEKTGIP
jgi:hypothetical protein